MDVREKLIEILEEPCGGLYPACELADYLLDSGVTVQECKLGDKIYQVEAWNRRADNGKADGCG